MGGFDKSSSAEVIKPQFLGERMRARTCTHGITCRASRAVANLVLPALMFIGGTTAWCLTANRTTAPDLNTCLFSNDLYESDSSLARQKVPTHFRVMTGRYVEIVEAARGKNCSGTATVAFNGHAYIQAGNGDDPGIAELIPTISSVTKMSLAVTLDLIVFAVISLGILIGYMGFCRLHRGQRARWVGAVVFLCLGLAEATVADVYIFQISPLIGGIPWVLHFALRRKPFGLYGSMAMLAFCCSWCSLVRSGTTPICLAFLVPLLNREYRIQRTLLPLLVVIFACVPSLLFERYLITHRDAVLAGLGQTSTDVNSHPIWHSIYIGLGFIPNSEVPEYNDAVAIDKVRSKDATVPYTSKRYELILRGEVFRIAKQRPWLLIENLAAKSGVVILLAAILLLPAWRFLFAERKIKWLDAAFGLAIGMSAMNAILVMPRPRYLLSFLCLTVLYSSTKLCRALSVQMEHDSGRRTTSGLLGWLSHKDD